MKNKTSFTHITRLCLCALLAGVYSFSFGQTFNPFTDCGTWAQSKEYITNWVSIDTINYCEKCDTVWTYTAWGYKYEPIVTLAYRPCGDGKPSRKYQNRVNNKGIIQQRWHIIEYEYIPKPKTEYEMKLDSLNDR
jgi:hypothetical protein